MLRVFLSRGASRPTAATARLAGGSLLCRSGPSTSLSLSAQRCPLAAVQHRLGCPLRPFASHRHEQVEDADTEAAVEVEATEAAQSAAAVPAAKVDAAATADQPTPQMRERVAHLSKVGQARALPLLLPRGALPSHRRSHCLTVGVASPLFLCPL